MAGWTPFPYPDDSYEYSGDRLADAWEDLHRGDREPWPAAGTIGDILAAHPAAAPADFDGDLETLASRLQDAWRHFHRGEFERAVEIGDQCGLLGHAPANKSTGIHAVALEDDTRTQRGRLEAAMERGTRAVEALPEDANAYYFYAFAVGRFSQCTSVVKAIQQGLTGRIRKALEICLEHRPDHADAHIAFGAYHAEIIDKVGKMIGGMTYGANADEAIEHFETAIELTPDQPVAYIEYGNGLYLMFGDKRLEEVTDLYVKASEMTPRDAMERLDVEAARSELE